jgi:hypothetical protein
LKKQHWIILGAYVALVVLLSMFHEMWRDEVRALSVAIDAPSWPAMIAGLHHEGHPSLWYVILRAGYALSHSTLVLPVAALSIAIAAAWLVLRHAPFPMWLKAMTVLGAFLGYDLSVVARNYGIGVLLMIVASFLFGRRHERPLLLALTLALLANTSVHAAAASLILLGLWMCDALDRDSRALVFAPRGIGSVLLVLLGIAVALFTASPSSDMAWGSGLDSLDLSRIVKAILIDPGKGLMGFRDSNIAAVGEYPWRILGIDSFVASRVIVDAALLWMVWNLRKSWRAVVAVLVAVVAFEVVFQNLYTASPRHEALLFFLLISICWITAKEMPRHAMRAIAPLVVLQAIAMPILMHRVIRYNESSSKDYAAFLQSRPEYRNAILMGEPDFFMEPMRYYVANRIYMPRQAEFANVAYFDRGARRATNFTLGQLEASAETIACKYRSPVLIAIWTKGFRGSRQGSRSVAYGAHFSWTLEERVQFRAAAKRVAIFRYATTDEVYEVFEVPAC